MSDIRQNIVFPGSGLNTDDAFQYMPTGDARERRNILVGEDESNGVITQMLGCTRTVDIADHELYLSNVYKVIGSYYNRLTRKVYYFIFSQPYEIGSSGDSTSTTTTTTTESGDDNLIIDYTSGDFQYDNMLLEYIEDTQELNVIFRDHRNYFGLHFDYPMRDLVMIGDLLYFNPRVSEPKVIDVVRAYNYTNYDAYDATLPTGYSYGSYVTFYGGLFRAATSVGAGETPSTTEVKWDKIGDSYQNESSILTLDSEFRYAFNVIKSPPKDRVTFSYEDDTSVSFNNVRGRVFKFTHRYQYFDNSYSVFSAFSNVTLPLDDEYYNGEVITTTQLNNFLRLSFSPFSPALVKYIEIYFQEVGQNWRRCKIFNRIEQSILDYTDPFTYDFYNNEAYENYGDNSVVSKVADSVPKKSNSQEIINKNILCYGGVTEGFDNTPKEDIDVVLTPEIEHLDVDIEGTTTIRNNYPTDFSYGSTGSAPNVYYYIRIEIGSWYVPGVTLAVGDYYVFAFNLAGITYRDMLQLTAPMLVSSHTLADAIRLAIIASGHANVTVSSTDDIVILGNHTTYPNVSISGFIRGISVANTLTKYTAFKTGAFHPFCIFYYDEPLRRWDAQTSKTSENTTGYSYAGTTVYIPMLNEISPVPSDTGYKWNVNWEVNHLPPEGAKYWRWGYAGNGLCSYFVQYIVSSIEKGSATWDTNMLKISIEPLQTLTYTTETDWNQFPHSKITPYVWQKGDRIRFITEKPVDITAPNTRLADVVEGVYDYEIIKQGDTGEKIFTEYSKYDPTIAYVLNQYVTYDNKLYKANGAVAVGETPGNTPAKWDKQPDPFNYIYTQYFDPAIPNIGENTLVEIYRPIESTEKLVYYEFGDLMPIFEDSIGVMVHGGQDSTKNQDTNTDTPATGTFNAGDVYHIYRTPSKRLCENAGEYTASAFHESQWYSDFYDSDHWNQGKSGVESDFGERFLNIIRFSNPYLQDTKINGLPTFEALNYKELNDVFGNIVAIYEMGDTLKCYQERKASSIFIGRTEYTDAQGNTSVAISTSVLGAIRYSPTNFSTVFPESIQRNNRYIYGFDIYNGVMWRDSANGIFPISGRYADAGGDADYKMATWFKDKSKDLLVSGIEHCDVMSVWDEEFKNLHVIFVDYVEELNSEVVVFHEPSNRWICFQDLDQTPASHNVILELTYDIIKGFEGGLGYSFDEDTRFAIFNILTPGNKYIDMDLITLNMTAYSPSVMADAVPDGTLVNMGMTPYTPSVHISYVTVTNNNMAWADSSYGIGSAQTSVITTTEAFVTVTSIPAWMTGKDETLHTVIAGVTTFANGDTITLYPTSPNTGGDKTGSVIFTDSPYGNTALITVTHWGVPDYPEVFLQVKVGETFTITDSTTSNTYVNVASTTLHVGFTAHDMVLMNTNLVANVWKNAVWYMSATVAARNETLVNRTITLADAAGASDVYLVELSEP